MPEGAHCVAIMPDPLPAILLSTVNEHDGF
jgi:hypothetical protein